MLVLYGRYLMQESWRNGNAAENGAAIYPSIQELITTSELQSKPKDASKCRSNTPDVCRPSVSWALYGDLNCCCRVCASFLLIFDDSKIRCGLYSPSTSRSSN